MQHAADKYPERVRKMFIDLSGFYSEVSLEDRINTFIHEIDTLAKDNSDISKSGTSFHHDFRAVSVYLFMMDPKRYYIYMYTVFKNFAHFVELDIPEAGDVQLLLHFYHVCDEIGHILQKEHKDWYEDYLQIQKNGEKEDEIRTDVYGHLLIQDIVFSLYYYHNQERLNTKTIVQPKPFKKKPVKKAAKLGNGVVFDYEAKQRKNSAIGAAAENFVFENEKRLVGSYGFDSTRVQHISKEQGDGLGYDILSCDKDGNEIYIEVKGTKGGIGTAFYITETELQCSIFNKEKYRLYRVYDFSQAGTVGTGKIAVIEGSLEPYCINPVSYKVVF